MRAFQREWSHHRVSLIDEGTYAQSPIDNRASRSGIPNVVSGKKGVQHIGVGHRPGFGDYDYGVAGCNTCSNDGAEGDVVQWDVDGPIQLVQVNQKSAYLITGVDGGVFRRLIAMVPGYGDASPYIIDVSHTKAVVANSSAAASVYTPGGGPQSYDFSYNIRSNLPGREDLRVAAMKAIDPDMSVLAPLNDNVFKVVKPSGAGEFCPQLEVGSRYFVDTTQAVLAADEVVSWSVESETRAPWWQEAVGHDMYVSLFRCWRVFENVRWITVRLHS